VVRLTAFVVAPELPAAELRRRVLTALRERVDTAFLPRRIVAVPSLPREPGTGKLPANRYAAWAEQTLAGASRRPARD
jgi:acyl-coenzyme A synthetase/AMP-(fatty) acid ligase